MPAWMGHLPNTSNACHCITLSYPPAFPLPHPCTSLASEVSVASRACSARQHEDWDAWVSTINTLEGGDNPQQCLGLYSFRLLDMHTERKNNLECTHSLKAVRVQYCCQPSVGIAAGTVSSASRACDSTTAWWCVRYRGDGGGEKDAQSGRGKKLGNYLDF